LVLIDEYGVSVLPALEDKQCILDLQAKLRSKVIRIEDCFDPFFVNLKNACGNGFARSFITGVTPINLPDNVWDITCDPALLNCMGLRMLTYERASSSSNQL